MDSAIEFGECGVCGKEAPLRRRYFNYGIKCECHSPTHFVMVRYCENCEPKEPEETKILLRTDALEALAKAVNNHDKLVEALEFYANEDNYNSYGCPERGGFADLGDLAREALSALKEASK